MTEAVQLELVKGLISLLILVLTVILLYFVGRYLTDRYTEQKKTVDLALIQASQFAQKQRELQLKAAGQFYELYGEFFAVWKLWSAVKTNKVPSEPPRGDRLELYERICAAEGDMEAVFVRLATEFQLAAADIETLGKFRQAYHALREAIRDAKDLGWTIGDHSQYVAFKRLACLVATMLNRQAVIIMPSTHDSPKVLREITDNKWMKDWYK